MDKLKYPIGIDSFPDLRQGGYAYVDKTRYVAELIDRGKYLYLGRPSGFGKTLLLSTIEAYFEGKRELFEGLALDKMDMDWNPHPVLRFDLTKVDHRSGRDLKTILDTTLTFYESRYGTGPVVARRDDLCGRFGLLIERAQEQTGQRVVILVDGYNDPLADVVHDHQRLYHTESLLYAFFGHLKSSDKHIKFALLTGVIRFKIFKVPVDVNNISDMTLWVPFKDICGFTEDELMASFCEGIGDLADKINEPVEETLSKLRDSYGGYLFGDEGGRLFNPYKVMKAFGEGSIFPYSNQTVLPEFVIDRIKEHKVELEVFTKYHARRYGMLYVNVEHGDLDTLLLLTGFITIDFYDRRYEGYKFRIPNTDAKVTYDRLIHP